MGTRNSYKQQLHKFSGNVSGLKEEAHTMETSEITEEHELSRPWTPVTTAHRLKGSGEELPIP